MSMHVLQVTSLEGVCWGDVVTCGSYQKGWLLGSCVNLFVMASDQNLGGFLCAQALFSCVSFCTCFMHHFSICSHTVLYWCIHVSYFDYYICAHTSQIYNTNINYHLYHVKLVYHLHIYVFFK